MKIEGKWKEELTTIETMTVKQLAQIPPVIKTRGEYRSDTEIRKIMEVEPLLDGYVAVKFLTWKERYYS
jgi:hypothetical protein